MISVRQLASRPPDPDHQAVERAIRDAATALDTLSAEGASGSRLRELANRLGRSPRASLAHADIVKEALAVALQELRSVRAPARVASYQAALAAFSEAVDALDPAQPMLEQRPESVRAFRSLLDATFLAAGHLPPFAEARSAGVRRDELVQLTQRARSEVLELSRATWTEVRPRAGSILDTLADVVEAMDVKGDFTQPIADIRFEAKRLRRADRSSFGQASWIRRALLAALDALDGARGCDKTQVTFWTGPAREAVTAIAKGGALSFERATIQDGFRATADAFGAAAHSERLCRFRPVELGQN